MKTNYTLARMAAGLLSAGTIIGLLPLAANAIESSPLLSRDSVGSTEVSQSREGEDLMASGRELYRLGQFAAAAEKWQQAVEVAESQKDLTVQAVALSYLSSAYQELNQWDLAQRAVDNSLEILEPGPSEQVDAVVFAQVLNTQAGLAYHLGKAESALGLWEQAEASYRRADDKSGVLGSRINQAQALQSLGFYRRSRQQLEAIAEQLKDMPDSELKVNGLRTLGTALQVLGDLPASRTALFESANIAVALESTTELSATYLSLGKTAEDWGDMWAAMDMFERAKTAAVNADDALQADLNRLRLYVEAEMVDETAPLVEEIVSELNSLPPSRLSVYGAVNLSASLAKENKQGRSLPVAKTNELLSTAVKSAQSLGDRQAEAYALDQQGALYMETEQWAEARKLTERSLDIARSIEADDIASQSAWQLGQILKQQHNTIEAIAAYGEAIESLQSLRSDLVAIDPDVQFSFRENIEPIYREMVRVITISGVWRRR
ncbi:MAG: tetratricopeptide repeat protein [Phormidesmis sp.]